MHLVPKKPSVLSKLPLVPLGDGLTGEPANDSGDPKHHVEVTDLNVLVGAVVGHVAARARLERVNIELLLATGKPLVHCDPTELAFAISGVVSANLRNMEEADGGDLRVELHATNESLSVVVASDELPPLGFVRAVEPQQDAQGTRDPTIAHCRRLIEVNGGKIELAEEHGCIGFAIVFPTAPLCNPVWMPKGAQIRRDIQCADRAVLGRAS